jgi:hypothetical protein
MPFKQGEWVVYTGAHPGFEDSPRIGSVGQFQRMRQHDQVTAEAEVTWVWGSLNGSLVAVWIDNIAPIGRP